MEITNSTAGMQKNDYLKCPYCGWIFEWNAYFRCPSCYKEVNYDHAKEAFRKDTMK
jgi:rubrerythrin